jgi:hypothetical protein
VGHRANMSGVWDDNELCEPGLARARRYQCCTRPTRGSTDCAHAFGHWPGQGPRFAGGELLAEWIGTDEDEFWIVTVHGYITRHQPGPLDGWRDAWVTRVDGETLGLEITESEIPADERAPLVREFLVRRELGGSNFVRGQCIDIRRPDPLFRLEQWGRRLWFDARWPLPHSERPLRVLTGGRGSAGWTDLSSAHEFVDHVRALDSPRSLVTALHDTAEKAKWGGVVITRGGGGRPGRGGEWTAIFDDAAVVDAVYDVQESGLTVLVGIGHEADSTWVEEVADFSWATPSALAATLTRWRAYLRDELRSPDDGLTGQVYAAGRSVRDEFDDAWLRARAQDEAAHQLRPSRRWFPS